MKTEIKFPVNPTESINDHNSRVNQIINPIIVNSLADEIGAVVISPTKKTKTSKKQIEKTSITNGASAVDFTPTIGKQIDTQYPNLIKTLSDAGLLNGSKFFRIYFRHTEKNDAGKSIPFYLFVKNAPTPKILSDKPAAPKNGLIVLTTAVLSKKFPTISKFLSTYHDAVLIITITRRGTDYRTLHYNAAH